MRAWTIAASILAAVLVSGCTSGASDVVYLAAVSGGKMTFGHAYDGLGRQLRNASDARGWHTIEGASVFRLHPSSERGLVSVLLHGDDSCDGVFWNTFGGPMAMQRGIARDVRLHGDSGQGSASFPSVDARVAAWGPATLYANSAVLSSLPEREIEFDAHLFVTKQGIRTSDDQILGADGRPYDPSRPSEAAAPSGRGEIHLELVGRGQDEQGFVMRNYLVSDGIASLGYRRVVPLVRHFFEGQFMLEAEIKGLPGDPVSNVRVAVVTQGREVASSLLTAAQPKAALNVRAEADAYQLVVTGNSTVGLTYLVAGQYVADEIVITMYWDAWQEGGRAEAIAKDAWIPSRKTCPALTPTR